MLSDLFIRLRALFRPKSMDTELADELRFHLDRQRAKLIESGLSPEEAARRARLEFGGPAQITEDCREARGIQLLEILLQDTRYALRALRKNPGFAAVALLTLALGIGANTAIFSVVYGVLLRPLPYADSASLLVMNETTSRVGLVSVSYPNFIDWRAQSRSFSGMSYVSEVGYNLAGVEQPETISGFAVSTNFLSIAGVRPLLGRDFSAAEEKPGAAPALILSYRLWQSHFGGESSAIGRSITLNSRPFVIIGVLPPEFRWIGPADVLEPIGVWLTNNKNSADRGARGDSITVARVAPGVSIPQARSEMDAIALRLSKAYPEDNDQFGVSLQPIRDVFVSGIRPVILVLAGAVLFVLLIACANVANLFLMRGAGRAREIALRIAIGATRGRIAGQMLAESSVLAFFGGLLGVGLAAAGIKGIASLIPAETLAGATVTLNPSVLLFAACATILSAVAFGLAPALQSAKSGVQSRLKESGRSSTAGAAQHRWRAALVVVEISLSVTLLAGAGLMLKSLTRLLAVDGGFRTERVLTMDIILRGTRYRNDATVLNFWDQFLGRVRTLPGVESAAMGSNVPLTNQHSRSDIYVEGMPVPAPGSFPHPDRHFITPGYLRTLGVPLLRGRDFTDADLPNTPRVAMVNARLARELFPDQDPIGRRFMFGSPQSAQEPRWFNIVAVVADNKLYGLANQARLEVYTPFLQANNPNEMTLVVKSRVDPAALTSSIRGVVSSIDRDQPIYSIATMDELVRTSEGPRRITLILLGLFSGLALVLAAIGIYGVISYSVAQRTHEIGIRMALGAQQYDVLRMVLLEGGRIAVAGVAIGIAAALTLTRWLEKLLFSVSPFDPITFAAVALVLAVVALLACYIPARRTLRVDPVIALRYE